MIEKTQVKNPFPKDLWRQLKAVLIDFDGTLVDSHPILYEAYSRVLTLNGKTPTKEEFQSLAGPTMREIVQRLKERHQLKSSLQDLYVTYQHLLGVIYANEIQLFPGAYQSLQKLKELGLKVALVTSSTRDLIDRVFTRLELKGLFDDVFTADLVERGKPHPDLYQLALDSLALKSYEALAIEDSPSGVKAATSAKLFTFHFNPRGDRPLDLESHSIAEVNNWDQIYRLIEEGTYER